MGEGGGECHLCCCSGEVGEKTALTAAAHPGEEKN